MSAQIIQFSRNAVAPREPQAAYKSEMQQTFFEFDGIEYRATFNGGELRWVRKVYYRIQGGRRVACSRSIRGGASRDIIDAAWKARRVGKLSTAPARSAGISDADLKLAECVDNGVRLLGHLSRQTKAGRLSPDERDVLQALAPMFCRRINPR